MIFDTSVILYISTAFNFLSYYPDFYSMIKNKNLNLYNIPEGFFVLMSGGFGIWYSIKTEDTVLLINFSVMTFLDIIYIAIIVYYSYYNCFGNVPHEKFKRILSSKSLKPVNDDLVNSSVIDEENVKQINEIE